MVGNDVIEPVLENAKAEEDTETVSQILWLTINNWLYITCQRMLLRIDYAQPVMQTVVWILNVDLPECVSCFFCL